MHLLTPWWWLLFLPLAAGLILLYLLKLRRRDVVVSSTLLWQQVLQDYQANAPFQKLRRNLLLFIQLLILLLVIAALSRPAMTWLHPGNRHVVLVIDASASMQGTDVTPSRFAVAKRAGHRLIEGLGPHDRMMLISIGGATQALSPFTSDKRALHDTLNRLRATDAPGDLRGALELAAGLVQGRPGEELPSITVISDGALPPVTLAGTQKIPIYYQQVGRRGDNMGITMLDVRRKLRGAGYEGLIGMQNFSAARRSATLELYLDNTLQDAREVTLAPRGSHSVVLDTLPTDGGVLRAELRIRDDLAVDNRAEVLLPSAEPIPVVLATPGNLFLATALRLDPTLQVTVHDTVPSAIEPGSILIADRVPVGVVSRGVPVLSIGQVPALAGSAGTTVKMPAVLDWARQHPAMRHIDPSGWHIGDARTIQSAGTATPLVEVAGGPIAVAAETHGCRMIALGWDLFQSDVPLHATFPIFLANCLDWLSGERVRAHAVNFATGQPVRVPVPVDAGRVTLTAPNGRTERLTPQGGVVVIDRLVDAGQYRITAGKAHQLLTANLVNAAESNIAPQKNLRVQTPDGQAVPVTQRPLRTEREFWRMLALIALALLSIEWWVFHRRVG